ncbi:hypothetical protein [Streptomyces sp. NPDC050164]|uniref:hypothetical protein n=1 Tax=Streptomyces sp. NPDC050164 TaxID=3365605 RepID=UPI00378E4111
MYILDFLYALICLAIVITGTATLIHLRGEHDHGPDCRPCRVLNRVLRRPPR